MIFAALSAASLVTLYCNAIRTDLDDASALKPHKQIVLTVDYDKSQVYVVESFARAGRVLVAKNITSGSIELPDFNEIDLGVNQSGTNWRGRGVETINRSTGGYLATTYLGVPSLGMQLNYKYEGSCQPGSLVPFPQAQF